MKASLADKEAEVADLKATISNLIQKFQETQAKFKEEISKKAKEYDEVYVGLHGEDHNTTDGKYCINLHF